jgi:hypothetical protein
MQPSSGGFPPLYSLLQDATIQDISVYVQEILRDFPNNFRGRDVGITDEMMLRYHGLSCHNIRKKR